MNLEVTPGAPQLLHDTPDGTQWRFPQLSGGAASDRGGGLLPQPDGAAAARVRDVAHVRRRRSPPAQPVIVTLSYNEAARMMDGGEQVDSVAMPLPLQAMLGAVHRRNITSRSRRRRCAATIRSRAMRRLRAIRAATRATRDRDGVGDDAGRKSQIRSAVSQALVAAQARRGARSAAPAREQRRGDVRRCRAGHRTDSACERRRASSRPQAPLPAVESLSFDSDFTPFLKPDVDESRQAAGAAQAVRAIRVST